MVMAHRYKASLADMDVDQRGYAQGYNSAASSSSSSNSSNGTASTMTVDYNTLGMPTPPLSPKPGKKRMSNLSANVDEGVC